MSSVEAEIIRRNARLRGLGVLGVPVRGAWEYRDTPYGPGVQLCLECLRCGDVRKSVAFSPHKLEQLSDPSVPLNYYDHGHACVCTHLAVLALDDPPELAPILALELLAG